MRIDFNGIFQYLTGLFFLSTASLSIGTVLGFSAILLPQLEDETGFSSKSAEASWIGKLQQRVPVTIDQHRDSHRDNLFVHF